MRFRLVPKSTTLDDIKGHYALYVSKHARLSESTTKISISYYRRQRCSAMTVVSGNIRFMRIFAGVPWRRGVKWQWRSAGSGVADCDPQNIWKNCRSFV